jgi:hypothetical protein
MIAVQPGHNNTETLPQIVCEMFLFYHNSHVDLFFYNTEFTDGL